MKKSIMAIALGALIASAPAWAQTTQQPSTTVPPAPPAATTAPPVGTPPTGLTTGTGTAGTTTTTTVQRGTVTMSADDHLASRLIGSTIRSGTNESIGDINDIVIDNSGRVKAVIAGIGGFLGIGEHRVMLQFDQLQLNRDSNNRLFISSQMTRDQLRALPEWRDLNEVTRAR